MNAHHGIPARGLCALALCLALTACGGSDNGADPSLRPGQLLSSEKKTGYPALPDAAENYLITYVSSAHDGRNTVVSGQVAIPGGTPPAGGFPVVSYAWGTSGPSDNCAPSNRPGPNAVNSYLNNWVKRGYAVLQTDYEGWGTPGQPTENGKSNALAAAHIVTAAHELSDRLGNDWIMFGHSLGGGAALWAAGLMRQTGDRYPLKGVIANAPVGPGILQFVNDAVDGKPVAQAAQPFISIVALAAHAARPDIDLESLIAAPMMPQLIAARTQCIGELARLPQLQPGQYYRRGASFDAMARYVKEQDASSLTLQVPAFVVQAGNDQTTVTPPTTQAMVRELCSRGASILYKEYPGETHGTVALAAAPDAFEFAATVFSGRAPRNDCR